MIAPLRKLQALVLDETERRDSHEDVFLERVADALRGLRTGAGAGKADVAALLRQGVLRCQDADTGRAELRVPRGRAWPDERMWCDFRCDVSAAGDEYIIRPNAWVPDWLDHSASSVIDDAMREVSRRVPHQVAADPLVTEYTGFTTYSSPGQREAVRAAFLMEPGSTVIVNLPTGSGKTLAFQLPALRFASSSQLTVVLVPTVALARDQDARFRELLQRHPRGKSWSTLPFAYYGGLSEEAKCTIATGVRNGTLPIVFASPEAVLGALRSPLFEAAKHGRLRLFAVDEAHIVSQWGQQFRPEFQSVAGLRTALLEACPAHARFRTLLLTATLTSESLETLRLFFGRNSQVVSEAQLRSEPGFLLRAEKSEEDRGRHVIEALRFLPRPLILYTTRREDAEQWTDLLRTIGFQRLHMVRGGDVSGEAGDEVLRDWRTGAVDIVVATSAFGLGMDQSDVRSVVHACLPESIDRYYQEVGRGGRDGCASVALLLSTERDVEDARRIANEMIISAERGFERWDAMFRRGRSGEGGTLIVSLDDRPPNIAATGKHNKSWNLRTLVLMARAGMIEFGAHAPPQIDQESGESEQDFDRRRRDALDAFFKEVAVHIQDQRHSDGVYWDQIVQRVRSGLRDADRAQTRLILELRALKRPISDIFRDVYTIQQPFIRPPEFLGSCPTTRAAGSVSSHFVQPEVLTLGSTAAKIDEVVVRALSPAIDDVGRAWISYERAGSEARDARRWRDRIWSLLRFAVSHGFVEFCVPVQALEPSEWSQLSLRATHGVVVCGELAEGIVLDVAMPLPRLTWLSFEAVNSGALARAMRLDRPNHVLLVPEDARDPRHPDRRLFDVVRHLTLSELIVRLES